MHQGLLRWARRGLALGSLSICLCAAGCASTLYREPKTLERPVLSNVQAQQALAASLDQMADRSVSFQQFVQAAPALTDISAWEDASNGGVSYVRWRDQAGRQGLEFCPSAPCATQFAQALYALKYWGSPGGRAELDAQESDFKAQAQAWRARAPKPPLSEDARRYQVLAEDAYQHKDFIKAARYYEQGLQVAPLWPEGYFNAALLYGETGQFAQAAWHMDRYLALCPDSADSRAARDKMYIWQEKAKDPAAAAAGAAPSAPAAGGALFRKASPQPGNDLGNAQQPCFIATAAYGTPSEVHVLTLRRFRDHFLVTHAPGRWLVGQYYNFSPPIADMIRHRPWARLLVRTLLLPAVVLAGAALGTWTDIMLVAAIVGGTCLAWRRRKSGRRTAPVPA